MKKEVNFEEIVCKSRSSIPRQYRNSYITNSEYFRVLSTKGASSNFGTEGGGLANWYMYHTMDDRIVCVISSLNDFWSWQYEGIPKKSLSKL